VELKKRNLIPRFLVSVEAKRLRVLTAITSYLTQHKHYLPASPGVANQYADMEERTTQQLSLPQCSLESPALEVFRLPS
jgi:hypothetical protein